MKTLLEYLNKYEVNDRIQHIEILLDKRRESTNNVQMMYDIRLWCLLRAYFGNDVPTSLKLKLSKIPQPNITVFQYRYKKWKNDEDEEGWKSVTNSKKKRCRKHV